MRANPFGFLFTSVLGTTVAIAIVACGGNTTSSGGVIPAPPSSDFASAFAHALCDNVQACCQSNALAFNAANCLTAMQGIAQADLINPAMAAGATYNPAQASSCLSEVAAAAKSCSDGATSDPIATACEQVFTGKKQPGESCVSSADCAADPSGNSVQCLQWSSGSSTPDGGTTSTSGSECQVQTAPKAGAACASGGSPPPSTIANCDGVTGDFRCDFTTNTCAPKGAIGQTCFEDSDCVAAAYCDQGACAARLAPGASCLPSATGCDTNSYCDPVASTCVAKKSAGQACDSSIECGGECTNNKCISSMFADPSFCGG